MYLYGYRDNMVYLYTISYGQSGETGLQVDIEGGVGRQVVVQAETGGRCEVGERGDQGGCVSDPHVLRPYSDNQLLVPCTTSGPTVTSA